MSQESMFDRFKAYEACANHVLPRRLPIIIRCDGKAFHTYTAKCERPFDVNFQSVMVETAIRLCQEIQGAQLAYVQSDEISVLVHGYKKITSEPWFGNQIQKMSSVAASVASATFTSLSYKIWSDLVTVDDVHILEEDGYAKFIKPAYFDARTCVVPENDVNNYFIWRQQDATRNSVQMLAQHVLGHKTCMNKDVNELKDVLASKQTPWENMSVATQRGTCITRKLVDRRLPTGELVQRSVWSPDTPTPEFRNDPTYVERLLMTED